MYVSDNTSKDGYIGYIICGLLPKAPTSVNQSAERFPSWPAFRYVMTVGDVGDVMAKTMLVNNDYSYSSLTECSPPSKTNKSHIAAGPKLSLQTIHISTIHHRIMIHLGSVSYGVKILLLHVPEASVLKHRSRYGP